MAPPAGRWSPSVHAYRLCFLLLASTATLSAAVTATSYSSACPSLPPANDRRTDGDDAVSLVRSFEITTGHFSVGSADSSLFSFSPDDDPYTAHSFSFLPHGASRTDDPALVHLTATFILTGPAASGAGGRRGNYSGAASVSFVLDGFHSSASLQLCMAGTGTERAADGSIKHYPDVVLRLRVPSRPSLADPFVVGTLEGSSGIGTVRLLAYAEGDDYMYGSERTACSPSPPEQPASASLRALSNSTACAHLKEELMTSYRLERGGASLTRMRVDQIHCTADDAGVHVRAYAVLSNDTGPTESRRYRRRRRQRRFLVREEAVVADGNWDSARRMLCLRACRVALPASPSSPAVRERDCGIGMSFWFPAVWTMRDRSAVAGMLWNYTQAGAGVTSGVITASSIDDQRSTTNFSDVSYIYNDTMMEEAKKHHLEISKGKKMKITGSSHSFPDFNYTASDFAFAFYGLHVGSGEAYPVTIGSAMVRGDRLAGDEAFFQHAVAVDDTNQGLVNVSYDITHSAPPANMSYSDNPFSNYSTGSDPERMRISAEGVYDPNRGILCMVGCRESNGSTDCRVLMTVQFAPVEYKAQGQGTGAISSLREKADILFFKKIEFTSYGMYGVQMTEAISRMDMESILLLASTTLSCVFIILQILHTKRSPEAAAAPATSITMLAVLTMGYLAPLVLNSEALFASRRSEYYGYGYYYPSSRRSLELNEVMMRAPILAAFVLQLRLLQLAWSGRRTSAVSEKTVLWICLPLYALGGAVAAIVHAINARVAMSGGDPSVHIHIIGGGPATMWEDLVSYAGLILDGFLLPQIVLNAWLGRSRVRAISPWFYMGGTVVRAAPHVYDVVRRHVYKQSLRSSDLYASPRGDLFGVAWDVVIPCGAALLAALLFLQQRIGGTTAGSLPSQSQRRRSGGYEMVVSNI